MNFIVSSSYLLKNLNAINGVITSNPVVPILDNVLFEIENGNLLITASDLQTSVMVEIQVESKGDGSVAIPAKILIDTLKKKVGKKGAEIAYQMGIESRDVVLDRIKKYNIDLKFACNVYKNIKYLIDSKK